MLLIHMLLNLIQLMLAVETTPGIEFATAAVDIDSIDSTTPGIDLLRLRLTWIRLIQQLMVLNLPLLILVLSPEQTIL